jgi:hypothetical protein
MLCYCFSTMNHKISSSLEISAVLAIGMTVIFASLLSASAIVGMTYPQQQQGVTSFPDHYGGGMNKPGVYAAGTIASLQNDKNGNPAWIVSGFWKGSLTNLTSPMSSSSNSSNTTTNKNLPTATFDAIFNMVMVNGTAMHKHEISNFTLTSISMPNEKTVVSNGTATITMKEGPVNAVPVSVRTMDDNVISIMPDPAKTKDHFGNTPIYGTITEDVRIKK